MEDMSIIRAIEDRVDTVGYQTMTSLVIKGLFFSKVPPGALFGAKLFGFNVLKIQIGHCGLIDNIIIVKYQEK